MIELIVSLALFSILAATVSILLITTIRIYDGARELQNARAVATAIVTLIYNNVKYSTDGDSSTSDLIITEDLDAYNAAVTTNTVGLTAPSYSNGCIYVYYPSSKTEANYGWVKNTAKTNGWLLDQTTMEGNYCKLSFWIKDTDTNKNILYYSVAIYGQDDNELIKLTANVILENTTITCYNLVDDPNDADTYADGTAIGFAP